MARVSRSRSRTLSVSGTGMTTHYNSGGGIIATYPQSSVTTGEETCTDSYGIPWADSAFFLRKGQATHPRVTGTHPGTSGSYYVSDRGWIATPMSRFYKPWNYADQAAPPISSFTQRVAMTAAAVANMNPNRTEVDIPGFIGELRELPHLIRDAVNILLNPKAGYKITDYARANLMAQFGLAPLISDLRGLLDFTEALANREEYLRSMSTGFRRIKRSLGQTSGGNTQEVVWSSGPIPSVNFSKVTLTTTWTADRWYTARARLTDPPDARDIHTTAFRSIFGLTQLDIATAWNLLPWSWLIDWFTTTGTYFEANRRGLSWQYEGLCLMQRVNYTVKAKYKVQESGFTYSPENPEATSTTKQRSLGTSFIFPVFKIPYIGIREAGILASLITLRSSNYH